MSSLFLLLLLNLFSVSEGLRFGADVISSVSCILRGGRGHLGDARAQGFRENERGAERGPCPETFLRQCQGCSGYERCTSAHGAC